jgi:hypothetical protein
MPAHGFLAVANVVERHITFTRQPQSRLPSMDSLDSMRYYSPHTWPACEPSHDSDDDTDTASQDLGHPGGRRHPQASSPTSSASRASRWLTHTRGRRLRSTQQMWWTKQSVYAPEIAGRSMMSARVIVWRWSCGAPGWRSHGAATSPYCVAWRLSWAGCHVPTG